ncbi:MAG: hypothetical protein GXO25_01545 [Euryarchaeota archaeon]|nr:hypothetical protein [Euryarchaeota archaeon]
MEGSTIPPPEAPGPRIGESTKLRSALDLLNIAKILALIIGIIGFLAAAWNGIFVILGDIFSIPWVGYYVVVGVINLILYTKIPEFDSQIRARRYSEAREEMLIWAVMGIIFGFIVGLILILVIFMYLEELERGNQGYVPPPQY